jgi:signal recognition particle subunit SRP54
MFEALTDRLQAIFQKLGSHGTVTEKDLDEAMREVRVALLEADVNFRVVREFISRVRERALGSEVLKSLTPAQHVIGIVNEELIKTLGDTPSRLETAPRPPTVILLVGLQGSGKTTLASKLGLYLRKQGSRPLLIAADVYRPAAVDQLVALGRQIDIPVWQEGTQVKPADIVEHGMAEARRIGATHVIVDTAGRLQIDEAMMAEVAELRRRFQPQEVLLVVDAMTGQESVSVAQEFHEKVGISGLVLTKMDGDARGGAALSIRTVTGVPVKFIGTGEKPDALEPFYPDRLASRILGMGDVLTLVEKAKESLGDTDVKELERKMKTAQFDLEDFLREMRRVRNMGPLSQLLEMLPGVGNIKKQLKAETLDDDVLKKVEAIICSMTPQERRNPTLVEKSGSRRRRIAAGSGTTPHDVNQLLNQFREARKLMQMVASARGGAGGLFSFLR